MQSRRMVGRNDGAGLFKIGLNQVFSDRNIRRDIEFFEEFFTPLRAKQLRANNENFGKTRAGDQFADD